MFNVGVTSESISNWTNLVRGPMYYLLAMFNETGTFLKISVKDHSKTLANLSVCKNKL